MRTAFSHTYVRSLFIRVTNKWVNPSTVCSRRYSSFQIGIVIVFRELVQSYFWKMVSSTNIEIACLKDLAEMFVLVLDSQNRNYLVPGPR